VLVIKSLGRLGRNYDEMLKQLEIITREKNAAIPTPPSINGHMNRWQKTMVLSKPP
jgi:hypothetical protein